MLGPTRPQPELPDFAPTTLDEAVSELDAANMRLYAALARFADLPITSRFIGIEASRDDMQHRMYATLALAIDPCQTFDEALIIGKNIVLSEDRARAQSLQTILNKDDIKFAPTSRDIIDAHLAGMDDSDDPKPDLTAKLTDIHGSWVCTDLNAFFEYFRKTPKGRAFLIANRLAPLALEGARVGAAVGLSLIVASKIGGRVRNA
jgi:hypothetical protein